MAEKHKQEQYFGKPKPLTPEEIDKAAKLAEVIIKENNTVGRGLNKSDKVESEYVSPEKS